MTKKVKNFWKFQKSGLIGSHSHQRQGQLSMKQHLESGSWRFHFVETIKTCSQAEEKENYSRAEQITKAVIKLFKLLKFWTSDQVEHFLISLLSTSFTIFL